MKVNNIIKEDIHNLSENIQSSLNKNNIDEAYDEMQVMSEKIEKLKRKYDMLKECKNFGIAKMRVENSLPKLFIENKQSIKNYLKLIKEDVNLTAQMQFLKSLENIKSDKINYKDYINECVKVAKNKINLKDLNKSNKKLINFIEENNISLDDDIDGEVKKMYESVDFLLSNPQNFKNIIEFNDNIESLASYYQKRDESINENKEYISVKNECLSVLNNLLTEDSDEKSELNVLKDKIINTKCSSENIEKLKEILQILKK